MAPIPLNQAKTDEGYALPHWECFACMDSGIVPDYLVWRIQGYESYDCRKHKNLLCQCTAKYKYSDLRNAFDYSLTKSQRQELHDYSRNSWLETIKGWANKDPKLTEMRQKVMDFITK